MGAVTERLRNLLKDRRIPIQRLTRELELGQGTLNKIFNEGRSISSEMLENILDAIPDLSEDQKYYIYTGEYLKHPPGVAHDAPSGPAFRQPPVMQDPVVAMYQWMTKIERELDLIRRELDMIKKR